MMRIANHVVLLLSALLVLSSCLPLDKEEEVRAELSGLVYLAQTRRFTSKPTCTAAIFDLASSSVRSQAVRIVSDVPGANPNTVSEQLMSISLEEGMGLLSSFIGPSMACMDDQFQLDAYYALMSEQSLTIYDPANNAIMLLHRSARLLFFMRGNV